MTEKRRPKGVQELPSYYLMLTTCDGTQRVPGHSLEGIRLLARNLLQIHCDQKHEGARCVLSEIGRVEIDRSTSTTIDPEATG